MEVKFGRSNRYALPKRVLIRKFVQLHGRRSGQFLALAGGNSVHSTFALSVLCSSTHVFELIYCYSILLIILQKIMILHGLEKRFEIVGNILDLRFERTTLN